jgi:peroxiredoxin
MSISSYLFRSLPAIVIGALILCPAAKAGTELPSSPPVSAGERPIVDLDLRSPAGDQVSLVPYIGRKPVVLVFWAAWCPICRNEAPRLNRLNGDPRIKVIAINEGDSIKKIQEFSSAYNVSYQLVTDPVSSLAKAFKVPGMPFCVIIGRSGLIVYRGSGLPDDLDYYLDQ